ncbi:MAG: ribosome silencing factor [Microbacteriaceae bacterium]|jgi:ribosome-associated protein|nr:ribosome silencing factor [Microbacteriaceae bacterium]
MTATKQAIAATQIAALAALDKLAENLVALDVSSHLALTDVFLLASGRSERQVAAISDSIEEKMLENGTKLLRREGKTLARWILLDFGDVIVHVMHEEDRMFYSLERLWNDCPLVKIPSLQEQKL